MPEAVKNAIVKLCAENHNIIVGDCYGIDMAVQALLKQLGYKNVEVYSAMRKARVNLGWWKEVLINSDKKGYLAHREKDIDNNLNN